MKKTNKLLCAGIFVITTFIGGCNLMNNDQTENYTSTLENIKTEVVNQNSILESVKEEIENQKDYLEQIAGETSKEKTVLLWRNNFMPAKKDLTGLRVGKLTVLYETAERRNGKIAVVFRP